MKKLGHLALKVKKTLKEEGVKSFFSKTKRYVQYNLERREKKPCFKDVLFINGCTLPHPERYRVDHQMEQLESNGLSVEKKFYGDIKDEDIKYYRTFVFFRCPVTPEVEAFIKRAKYFNKRVFFDIDDLVVDKKYTDTIPYVQQMKGEDRKTYDDGVIRMGKTLKMCDYVITTTTAMAREIKSSFGIETYINRNVASERMVELSLDAISKAKKNSQRIVIGYLSGSITHNPDFELIKDPLLRIMEQYSNVELEIVGYLDLPKEFDKYKDRIKTRAFGDWQALPTIISGLDINLAPLAQSVFNEAKSENKWVEAALCKVPTVASDFGAFKEMIKNGKTGFLCNSGDEWFEAIKTLIENKEKREEVASAAHEYVLKNCVTTYTGFGLTKYIESKVAKNYAFVLPSTNISGGVNVVIKHCNILRENGFDVLIINMDKSNRNVINEDGEINVVSAKTYKISARFYAMIATLFTTLEYVKAYPEAKRRMYLVQNFETDFCQYGSKVKKEANSTYNAVGIEYITISEWCKEWLKGKFDKDAKIAHNGIDLKRFSGHERKLGNKVKILIEGNSMDYYKNVDESFRIIEKLDKDKFEISYLSYSGQPKKWYRVDHFYHNVSHDKVSEIYANNDILLKSSILESFSYPPLEMLATGGFVVVAPNGGNQEYLKDEENCLFYQQGNIDEAVEKINKIVNDASVRNELSVKGKKTAENRSWDKINKEVLEMYK